MQITLASVPQLSVTTGCGGSSSSKAKLQPVRQLPCRDLESELQVTAQLPNCRGSVQRLVVARMGLVGSGSLVALGLWNATLCLFTLVSVVS